MSERNNAVLLEDILEAIERILSYTDNITGDKTLIQTFLNSASSN